MITQLINNIANCRKQLTDNEKRLEDCKRSFALLMSEQEQRRKAVDLAHELMMNGDSVAYSTWVEKMHALGKTASTLTVIHNLSVSIEKETEIIKDTIDSLRDDLKFELNVQLEQIMKSYNLTEEKPRYVGE